MERLPPGQKWTHQLWTVGESQPPTSATKDSWQLVVKGLVKHPCVLSYSDFMELPQETFQMDVHCVTSWSKKDVTFAGVPVRVLLDRAGVAPTARFVHFAAYSPRNHDTSLPLEVACSDGWIVSELEGAELPPERGGPLRLVTSGRYFYKSLKWLHEISLLESDKLGYWERESAYHNNADPFAEERFDESLIASLEVVQKFRELTAFDTFRTGTANDVLIKANFSQWCPSTKDLHSLQLKACKFDQADLSQTNLRDANLTLSDFYRADLSHADLTGADVEGANFAGAVLDHALFLDVHVSATTFFRKLQSDRYQGPKSAVGMRIRTAPGSSLLAGQEQMLRDIGVMFESN